MTVGTLLPGGKALARYLVEPLERIPGPRRILETGPGNGALTKTIVQHMGPHDTLTCVEIIPEFAKELAAWRETLPTNLKSRVRVVEGDFLAFEDEPFHLIINGVPLGMLPAELVASFFHKFHQLCTPETIVSSYEYLGSRNMRCQVPGLRHRQLRTERVIRAARARAELSKEWILNNVPPMLVSHFNGSKLGEGGPIPAPEHISLRPVRPRRMSALAARRG